MWGGSASWTSAGRTRSSAPRSDGRLCAGIGRIRASGVRINVDGLLHLQGVPCKKRLSVAARHLPLSELKFVMQVTRFLHVTLGLGLVLSPVACKKKGEGETEKPAEGEASAEADGKVDFVAQLEGLKGEVQAQVDTLMKPLNDGEQLVNMVGELPAKLESLKGKVKGAVMASFKAGFEGGKVTLELDAKASGALSAELKAEIEAILAKAAEVKTGLTALPDNVTKAVAALGEISVKLTGIATSATTQLSAKLKIPLLKAEAKAEIQGKLDAVTSLKGEIEGMIEKAKTDVQSLPQKGTELTAKLAGSFSAAAATK